MDAEIKSRWITALRSGDYEQTHRRLADRDGYCCLGVLCEIAVQDQVVFSSTGPSGIKVYTSKLNSLDIEEAIPPTAVKDWAGLPDQNPIFLFQADRLPAGTYDSTYVTDGKVSVSLSALNDSFGFTFDMIADVIEENF
jgi:hypothetical protein